MREIRLSNKYSIFRGEDKMFSSIEEELLYMITQNDKYAIATNDNSVWIEINASVFRLLNSEMKKRIEVVANRPLVNYAEHYWVYTQTKGFDQEWMHQHLLVHPSGRTKILTDYTFTYYVQTPKDVEGDEGHIVFEDEHKKRHKFLPKEGDWFIFPADIRHTAMPTPNSETDRIVYAGSICIDVLNQNHTNKSAI